ncbi:MAG TPA: TSUP family transporter, partial [Pyrinomonadaceae bacterium]
APLWLALLLGVALGLLSGLTGVGGGIFLSPLLLLAGWAGARQTAAVSAAFILVNSAAGLLGNAAGFKSVSAALPYFALAALAGGVAGTEFGSRRLPPLWVRRVLAVVLVVAGLKLIFA